MQFRIVTVLDDFHGIDISGNVVEMLADTIHVISESDVEFYLSRPTYFSVTPDTVDLAAFSVDGSGVPIGFIKGDGTTLLFSSIGVTYSPATTSVNGLMSATDKTKLNGIASNATANSSDAALLNRANHTGTQLAATISDFVTAVQAIAGSQTEPELAITASRDAILTDVGNILTSNETSAVVITIPSTATFNPPNGTILTLFQANTGAVSFAAGAGVTFEGTAPTSIENAHISIRKRTGNAWVWVTGSVNAAESAALVTLNYNPDGTVASIDADGAVTTLTYTNGNVTSLDDGTNTTTINYNGSGQVTSVATA